MFTVTKSLGMFTLFANVPILWADVAAAVSSPSAVLQLLSLADRSDQTHSLLFPGTPDSDVLSLAAKFLMFYQQYAVFSTVLYTALRSRTGPYGRICSGYFQGQITLHNKFQKNVVSVMNMLLIYLFASMKLDLGH